MEETVSEVEDRRKEIMVLSDIALIVDCPHSTAPDEGEGYPLIRTPNIGKGRLLLDGVHRVSKEVYDLRNKRIIPQENDILFAREAPAGNAAIISGGQQVCMGQRTVLIRPDLKKVNPHYLVYYILAPKQQSRLLGYSHGATVGHVNIPDIKNLEINIPELTAQNKIANILMTLDECVDNNNKRIRILEQMAENLYKEWFVRFRFPGHEDVEFVTGKPRSWEPTKLEEIINIDRGLSYSLEEIDCDEGTDLINLKNIQAFGGFRIDGTKKYSGKYKEQHIVQRGDLVMGVTDMTQDRRTVGAVALIPVIHNTSVISADLIKISSKLNNVYLYCMFKYGDVSRYRFTNNNHLAYFVAREINRNYHETGDDSDLLHILHNACFGINADILMFISYITDNVRILNLILQIAVSYTEEWEEFDFGERLPKFLQENRIHRVSLPPQNAKDIEKKIEIDSERKAQEKLKVIDIYDYDDDKADELMNKIIRSLQLLVVVSRCLPNFEHLMKKEDKSRFVNAIYTMPNKIFNVWAQIADKELDEIVAFFKEQRKDYFIRQKTVSDQDIIKALQWAAMSLLLELYGLPAFLATKEHTVRYLNDFDYSEKETYELEHLLMMERQSSPRSFINEAKRLNNKELGIIFATMLKRIVGHALVFKDELDYSDRQQLQAKFFPGSESKKKFLLERVRSKKREE